MRLTRRLNTRKQQAARPIVLCLLFSLSACSLPDVNIEKKQKQANAAGAGFFTKVDDHTVADPHASDKTYLATVHVRFTETGAPMSFDIRRDRRDLVSVNLFETQQTGTYMHLGYSHDDGGIMGLRFMLRF